MDRIDTKLYPYVNFICITISSHFIKNLSYANNKDADQPGHPASEVYVLLLEPTKFFLIHSSDEKRKFLS